MNHLFVLSEKEKYITAVSEQSNYYELYNNYLKELYFTDIKENCEFIPMDTGTEIIIILNGVLWDEPIEAEDVFEVMQDMLYMRV